VFASPVTSYGANAYKLELWAELVRTAPDGSRILLIDADTFVSGCLDPLWGEEFDVAYTGRDASPFPLNAGVIAIRAGAPARAFMREWSRLDLRLLRDSALHGLWRRKYGGINQAALGWLLESGGAETSGARVLRLPCLVWNCEDTSWSAFDPAVTKVVHVKSALRMAALGVHVTHALRPLARVWCALDRVGL